MTGTSAAVASPVDFARYGEYTVKTRTAPDGGFVRPVHPFTGSVTADGSSGYRAEPGRYHLYVSLACPWAHRSVIVRRLVGLKDVVSLSVVDPVYVTHFKANMRRLADYPNLWPYARDLYQQPAFGGTTDFDHIKGHYFGTHPRLNPSRIVPAGPLLDWQEPHHRERLAA
jgi:glutathionyl-hydroquinone reductase